MAAAGSRNEALPYGTQTGGYSQEYTLEYNGSTSIYVLTGLQIPNMLNSLSVRQC